MSGRPSFRGTSSSATTFPRSIRRTLLSKLARPAAVIGRIFTSVPSGRPGPVAGSSPRTRTRGGLVPGSTGRTRRRPVMCSAATTLGHFTLCLPARLDSPRYVDFFGGRIRHTTHQYLSQREGRPSGVGDQGGDEACKGTRTVGAMISSFVLYKVRTRK